MSRAAIWEGSWAASAAGRLPAWGVPLGRVPRALLGMGLWWSFQRVFRGARRGARRVRDLDLREASALFTLLMALVLVGFDPSGWLGLFSR